MLRPFSLAAAALILALAAHAQPKDGLPLMKPPLAASKPVDVAPGSFKTIAWDALVPADWDPFKEFKGLNFQITNRLPP